jgi:hypothetical protein
MYSPILTGAYIPLEYCNVIFGDLALSLLKNPLENVVELVGKYCYVCGE